MGWMKFVVCPCHLTSHLSRVVVLLASDVFRGSWPGQGEAGRG